MQKLLFCAGVCKYWNELFDADWIWRRLSLHQKWNLSPSEGEAHVHLFFNLFKLDL